MLYGPVLSLLQLPFVVSMPYACYSFCIAQCTSILILYIHEFQKDVCYDFLHLVNMATKCVFSIGNCLKMHENFICFG